MRVALLLLATAAASAHAPVCSSPVRPLPSSNVYAKSYFRKSMVTLSANARQSLYEQYVESRNDASARRSSADEDSATSMRDGYSEEAAGWVAQQEAAPLWAPAPEPTPASEGASLRFAGATAEDEVELLDYWRAQQVQSQRLRSRTSGDGEFQESSGLVGSGIPFTS